MKREIPPLLAVRAFEAVARLGTLGRAADELGLSQPGVSYQLRLLEDRIGTRLFVKAGRRLALTDIGAQIAARLTPAFDSIAGAFAIAANGDARVLTVSCSTGFGANWLAPRIGAFQFNHPEIAIRLLASDAIVDLDGGEADLAIRNSVDPWPGLVTQPLLLSPILPFASPEFLSRHPHCSTPDEVMSLPRSTTNDPWWSMWYEQVTGLESNQPRAGALRFDSQLLDGAAALAGHSVAILNALLWQQQIQQGLLVPVLRRSAFGRGRYWLTSTKRQSEDRRVRAFATWIVAEARAAREWVKSLQAGCEGEEFCR